MMRITEKTSFTADQILELEMHSFLNLVTIINAHLQVIADASGRGNLYDEAIRYTYRISDTLRHPTKPGRVTPAMILTLKSLIMEANNTLTGDHLSFQDHPSVREHIHILQEIFKVVDVRVGELAHMQDDPFKWHSFESDYIRDDLKKFFAAVSTNSKGRYGFVYNIAEKSEKDYLIHFEIDTDLNGNLVMPYLLKDVLRDLIANARKYSPVGSFISIGISIRNGVLKLVVHDNGYGIPADEVTEVVSLGYRASNVRDHIPTMGGGFGLTKAMYVVNELNGKMFIFSEEHVGTKIKIEIPVPVEFLNTGRLPLSVVGWG